MPKTAYNISLKGYVGGYDFDRATVDKELAKNDKRVSRINLVLDHMATNKTLKLWAFISQVISFTGNDACTGRLAARYRERPPQFIGYGR